MGLWEVIGLKEVARLGPHHEISDLVRRETPECSALQAETLLSRNQICLYLDLGFPNLQKCEK